MNPYKISVVIVTKNRAHDLLQALGSLIAQTTRPDEIVVIDNASSDETPKIVKSFIINIGFPIRYIRENKSGYPILYNRGLKEAKHDWVAFLDDDCVASPHWITQMRPSIRHQEAITAILGYTEPFAPQNIYSLVTHIFNSEWKENNSRGKHIFNLEILDNKNIVYNKKFLQKNHLLYDETRTVYLGGAGEDCDLGIQIQQLGGTALYNRSMLAFHKEPTGFLAYWNKYIHSLAAHEWFKEKWIRQLRKPTKNVHFRTLALHIAQSHNYSGLKLILLCILLYTTVTISMILIFLTSIPGMRMRFIRWVDQYLGR